jgi:7,8-dihydroneopterin aldolase/epimerase/oxygenase
METGALDSVKVRRIRAYGRHGTNPGEREQRQLILIDAIVEIDLHAAAASDDLAQTIDYAALRASLVRVVATTSYALLERLGADLLDVLCADRRVARAEVTLSKPGILDGATPSVTLRRESARTETA